MNRTVTLPLNYDSIESDHEILIRLGFTDIEFQRNTIECALPDNWTCSDSRLVGGQLYISDEHCNIRIHTVKYDDSDEQFIHFMCRYYVSAKYIGLSAPSEVRDHVRSTEHRPLYVSSSKDNAIEWLSKNYPKYRNPLAYWCHTDDPDNYKTI